MWVLGPKKEAVFFFTGTSLQPTLPLFLTLESTSSLSTMLNKNTDSDFLVLSLILEKSNKLYKIKYGIVVGI